MRTALILITLLTAQLAGCGPADSRADADAPAHRLTITGSSTCAPLISEIARRFEVQFPGTRIDVQTGGSSRGIADVGTGLADLGMSSRPLRAGEQAGRTSHALALDGICFVVHGTNAVEALTDAQLRGIYAGQIDTWQQVGGADAPITVINRAAGRSELELVTAYLGVSPAEIRADAIAGENQQAMKQVSTDPNAVAYLSVGAAQYDFSRGTTIRRLPLRGVPASSKSVRSGAYPLQRPLLLITATNPGPLVIAFIEFARSDRVNDLVRKYEFAPATP